MSFLPRELEPGEPTVMVGEEKEERDEYGDLVGGPKISKKEKKKNLAKNEKDEDHTTTTAEAVDGMKIPPVTGLGGGGGGTNAITMKSSDKSVGKRIKDVGNLVKRPFRTKEDRLNADPRSKFATEEIANSLGGGGIAGTIEGSGYDPNFTPPVDKKKKKKNRRKQVIGMWSRQLRKKK